MRERDRDQSPEEIVQPLSPGVGGGQVVIPRTEEIDDVKPHVKGEDPGSEEDRDSPEADDDLFDSGESPEFEHLRTPPDLSKPPGER
jgi:hypothetical protein